jgi:acetyl esterase/lipase
MTTLALVYFYFACSVLLLLNTVGVVKPRLFPPSLMLLGSVSFIVVALFAPQLMILGLGLTVALWWKGGLHYTLGQLGLVLHVAAWTLLGLHFVRMRTVLPILDGRPVPDNEEPFPVKEANRARVLPPMRITYAPLLFQRTAAMRDIKVTRGVVYRVIDGKKLRLDIYRPRTRPPGSGPQPSVVYLHGGAWLSGTRRQSPFLMYELAAAGYVVFSIDYRLAPRYPMPAGLYDCKAAIAWVAEHAAEYNTTPEAIVMGGSAGGHLAAMLAVSDGTAHLQPGFEDKSTRVRGAVVLYGIANLVGLVEEPVYPMASWLLERVVFRRRFRDEPDLFHRAQPLTYLSDKAPPILLVHGENDSLIPIEEARQFFAKLGHAGATRVHLCEIPLAVHAFEIVPSPLHQRAVRIIRSFMDSL